MIQVATLEDMDEFLDSEVTLQRIGEQLRTENYDWNGTPRHALAHGRKWRRTESGHGHDHITNQITRGKPVCRPVYRDHGDGHVQLIHALGAYSQKYDKDHLVITHRQSGNKILRVAQSLEIDAEFLPKKTLGIDTSLSVP
ncbi:hypothetical protein CMO91_00650 [Candidatus Woesearchaeota archaeon]|nr:hypothetical protein [Candidatus Woesearchaeota archaeon]